MRYAFYNTEGGAYCIVTIYDSDTEQYHNLCCDVKFDIIIITWLSVMFTIICWPVLSIETDGIVLHSVGYDLKCLKFMFCRTSLEISIA